MRQLQTHANALISFALCICLFLAPSNLFLKFDQFNWAVRGLRVDYLLPKLYASDVAGLLTLGLLFVLSFKPPLEKISRAGILLSSLGLFWLSRQFFTPYPAAAVSGALRLVAYAVLWWQVRTLWDKLHHTWLWWSLAASLVFQGSLGLYQFFTQHSLGNYYWLLGEPDLAHTYGIVHGSFGTWGELILPYGTTAHPNVLAGWMAGGWLLLATWQSHPLKILLPLGLVGAAVIGLTQSWSAAGLAITGLSWLSWKYFSQKYHWTWSVSQWFTASLLCLCLFTSPWWTQALATLPGFSYLTHDSLSWDRRMGLSATAVKLFSQHPWLGVGMNQFTAYLETANHSTEFVRFVQPVHQVGWLWLVENGVLGVILLIAGCWILSQQDRRFFSSCFLWLWLSLPLLVWDHYLLTLPTGLLLSWWWLLANSSSISKHKLI